MNHSIYIYRPTHNLTSSIKAPRAFKPIDKLPYIKPKERVLLLSQTEHLSRVRFLMGPAKSIDLVPTSDLERVQAKKEDLVMIGS